MKLRYKSAFALALAAALLAGCAPQSVTDGAAPLAAVQAAQSAPPTASQAAPPKAAAAAKDTNHLSGADLSQEAAALSQSPAAQPVLLLPQASGQLVKKNGKAIIDYSNAKDGYVMMKFTAPTAKRLKARVAGPATTYTYNLTPGQWETFPLSDGNGSYTFTIYENIQGTKYSTALSHTAAVTLTDQFAPFLRPNQYVEYSSAPQMVAKAAELTANCAAPLDKVDAVYRYVVNTLSYDYQLAVTVQSGYLPVLDKVLANKTGICFDYAALMTGMLRSQGIPCKLVVGYAGTAYHAWISVWTEQTGWIDGAIFFDGQSWHRMDPTFDSTGKGTDYIRNYIANDANYSAKYFY